MSPKIVVGEYQVVLTFICWRLWSVRRATGMHISTRRIAAFPSVNHRACQLPESVFSTHTHSHILITHVHKNYEDSQEESPKIQPDFLQCVAMFLIM